MKKILLVYIEPTPYIVTLVDKIKEICLYHIDVIFLAENHSQNWNIPFCSSWRLLPENYIKKLKTIINFVYVKKYNLLHLAGWSEPVMALFLLLAKHARIPVSIESDTPGHCGGMLKKIIKSIVYPPFFRKVDLFFPGGKKQAGYIASYGVKNERIVPVNMTVDVTAIQNYISKKTEKESLCLKKHYCIPACDIIFYYAGRLVQGKGLKDLIASFNAAGLAAATLVIAGEGDLKTWLEEVCKHNPKIIYAGYLRASKLLDVYHMADVFVFPSYKDAWGLVINEAMAAKLPVIVSDAVGCVEDLVIEGETGLIIKAGDVSALENAMIRLAKSPIERMQMAHAGSRKISEWTLENEAKKICSAWEKLV